MVFDPVLAASSGGRLFDGEPAQLLPLLARATLVTPNLAEAAAFTGAAGGRARARRWRRRARWWGWAPGRCWSRAATCPIAPTTSLSGPGPVPAGRCPSRCSPAPRMPGPGPRGTGCALATAIAVGLASGRPLAEAVAAARTWLRERLAATHDAGGGEHHLWK